MNANQAEKILDILNNSDYTASQKISDALRLSNKTVRNLIKELNSILNENGAAIVSKHGSGYKIDISESCKYETFMASQKLLSNKVPQTSDERIEFLLHLFVKGDEYIKLSELEEKLYITRNTLSKDLKKLEIMFAKYHVFLERTARMGVRIRGKEGDIRHIFVEYISQKNVNPENLDKLIGQSKLDFKTIYECIHKTFKEQGFLMSDFAFNNLYTHICISLVRNEHGYSLNSSMINLDAIKYSYEYEISFDLAKKINEKVGVMFPEPEIAYIAIHLAGKKIYKDDTDSHNIVISQRISDIVDEMIMEVWKISNFDFRSDIELKISLCQHLVALEIRTNYGMSLKNPLLVDMKKNYSTAYQMAMHASSVINRHFNARICDDEIGYISFSFGLALERSQNDIVKKNILLVCYTGQSSAKLLKYKYQNEFGLHLDKIYTCDVNELNRMNFEEIDYVISTVPIEISIPVPILEVKYFWDDKDIREVRKVLFEPSVGEAAINYYKESLFISSLSAKTRDEVINKMCLLISKNVDIPDNFCELVKKRELIARTEFGNLIAMPHPDSTITNTTFVCVAVLENRIIWEEKEVQVVFLISVEKDIVKDIKRFYKATSKFLLSRECIESLIETRDFNTLIKLIDQFDKE